MLLQALKLGRTDQTHDSCPELPSRQLQGSLLTPTLQARVHLLKWTVPWVRDTPSIPGAGYLLRCSALRMEKLLIPDLLILLLLRVAGQLLWWERDQHVRRNLARQNLPASR